MWIVHREFRGISPNTWRPHGGADGTGEAPFFQYVHCSCLLDALVETLQGPGLLHGVLSHLRRPARRPRRRRGGRGLPPLVVVTPMSASAASIAAASRTRPPLLLLDSGRWRRAHGRTGGPSTLRCPNRLRDSARKLATSRPCGKGGSRWDGRCSVGEERRGSKFTWRWQLYVNKR